MSKQLYIPDWDRVKINNGIARGDFDFKTVYDYWLFASVLQKGNEQINKGNETDIELSLPLVDILNHGIEKEKQITSHKISGRDYLVWRKAAVNLFRAIIIYDDNETTKLRHLFDECDLKKSTGKIKIKIKKEMLPIIKTYATQFTQFHLSQFLKLSTVRSQKLFVFLRSWQSVQAKDFKLSEIFNFLDIPKTAKNNSALFKRFLERAKNEIENKTDLKFIYSIEKNYGTGDGIIRFSMYEDTPPLFDKIDKGKKSFFELPDTTEKRTI
jgi:plasmid replication initiation protein